MTLSYDPVSRVRQTSASGAVTQFLYDGDRLVAEYNGAGVMLRRYVHGPGVDEPLVWYEGAGLTDRRWFHTDHQGTVIATSASSGQQTGTYAYGPYGEPANDNWTGARFRYTGQIALPEVRLYHYKARVYDPRLGRFLQTDPIGYEDDLNLYAYVANDPLNATDPTGTEWVFRNRNGNDEYTPEHESAIAYLMRSSMFREEFSEVEESEDEFVMQITDEETRFRADLKTLFWNPNVGGELPTGEIMSPALMLGHDVSHVAEYVRDPETYERVNAPTMTMVGETIVVSPGNLPEEARATAIERFMARDLGEPQRQNYRDSQPVITEGPTSRQRRR